MMRNTRWFYKRIKFGQIAAIQCPFPLAFLKIFLRSNKCNLYQNSVLPPYTALVIVTGIIFLYLFHQNIQVSIKREFVLFILNVLCAILIFQPLYVRTNELWQVGYDSRVVF